MDSRTSMKAAYQFNGYRLVPEDFRLEHQKQPVRLPPKAFRLLVALVEARGKLISKEELTKQVWPELQFVEPGAFDQTLFTLRKHLERHSKAEYVLTVPRQGYKWNVEVTDAEPGQPSRPAARRVLLWSSAVVLSLATLAAWLIVSASGRAKNPPPEALRALEEGRRLWRMRVGGEDPFRKAVLLAPNYAPAHAALAAAYAFHEPPAPEAFETVEKALSLDPNLGEAYATLGFIRMVHRWDWKGAEQAFQRALQLAPNYPTTHHWYGLYLRSVGRLPEARNQFEEAQRLDPDSPAILDDMGFQHMVEGRLLSANVVFQEVRKRFPSFPFAKENLLRGVFLWKGRKEAFHYALDAELPLENRSALSRHQDQSEFWDSYARAAAGWPYQAALRWMVAGRKDLALDALEEALRVHSFSLFELKTDPMFVPLHSEPRFQSLLQQIGLAAGQAASDASRATSGRP